MDITWVTDRIGVGGGIWNDENMERLVNMGVTHIIDMQIEFDDRPIAEPYDVKVLYNPTDDDFQPKPRELFQQGVEFALEALDEPKGKVYIHCAAGVHRAPMMTLAILRALGWSLKDAKDLIQRRRYVVDFADIYVESVEKFMAEYERNGVGSSQAHHAQNQEPRVPGIPVTPPHHAQKQELRAPGTPIGSSED